MLKREVTATFASHFFSAILALGSSAIIARILQPEGRGLLGLALLIPQTAAIFCSLGQGTVNATYAGLYKEKRIQLFQQSLLIAIFTAALSFLIIFAFFFWLPISRGEFDKLDSDIIYLICFIAPVTTFSMIILSLVRGVGRITTAAKINVFQSISLVVLLAVFLLWQKGGLKTVIIILTAERLFAIILSIWILRDYISLSLSHFSGRFFHKSLSFGFKCSIATLAGYLVYRFDQGILAYMVSEYQIGLYVVAVALAEKIKLLPNSIASAFLPRLANELEAREAQVPKVFRCTSIISFTSMLLVGILGIPAILIFFGRNYLGTIPSFLLLLPGIAALGGSSILSSDLAARNKPKYGVYIGWTGLAVNIALNLSMIPIIGIAGAAIASTISYILCHIMVIYFYRYESRVPIREMVPRRADIQYLWNNLITIILKSRKLNKT